MKRSEKIFIGIDFAKEKFDACYLDEDGIVAHAVFQNVKKEYRKVISWVKKTAKIKGAINTEEVLFCGEHTGQCSLPFSEWLVSNGYRIWLDNPARIKRSAGIVRGKSDKDDALMIANYAQEKYKPEKAKLFVPDLHIVKQLRELYCCRIQIVKERVGIGNRIKSGSFSHSSVTKKVLKDTFKVLSEQEEHLQVEMEKLMKTTPMIAQNYRILTSFKGIGPLTAAMLIIYTNNFTRFNTARAFACHIGIAPFGKDSGRSIHEDPHVSHFANKKAKAALVQSAKTAIIFNPTIREYAERLRKKGKHEGVIMNNVKNKIIQILFKMIETQKEWQADYHPSHNSANQNDQKLSCENKEYVELGSDIDNYVPTSPTVIEKIKIHEKTEKYSKLSKKSCPKICLILKKVDRF